MKRIQKLFILLGIITALFFAFSGEQKATHFFSKDKGSSFFSDNYLHSSACLQPQVTSVLSVNFQSGDYSIARFTETFLVTISSFKLLHPAGHFISQDPGHFKKVAVLLYPFHFFW